VFVRTSYAPKLEQNSQYAQLIPCFGGYQGIADLLAKIGSRPTGATI
jgi:hypothetical protein